MKQLERLFPHSEYRSGQRDMMQVVADVMQSKECALIHGATGIGKTACALAGSLVTLGEKKLVCLTRTKGQRDIFVKELERIQDGNMGEPLEELIISYVELRSKKDLCPRGKAHELSYQDFLDYCKDQREENACKYYRRSHAGKKPSQHLKKAVKQVYPRGNDPRIATATKKQHVCPYEIAKQLLPRVKIIIGSYHYLFNPYIRPLFLKWLGVDIEDLKIIVDEAHNLPQMIADMYTRSLSTTRSLRNAINDMEELQDVEEWGDNLTQFLRDFQWWIRDKAKKVGANEKLYSARVVPKEELSTYLDAWASDIPDPDKLIEIGEDLRSLGEVEHGVGTVGRFLEAFDHVEQDEKYVLSLTHKQYKGNAYDLLELSLIDPSEKASKLFNDVDSAVLMSGSLKPFTYYQKMLGLGSEVKKAEFGEKFHANRRKIVYYTQGSSKYERRNDPENLRKIRRAIRTIVTSCPKSKGVLLVFPSYTFMSKIQRKITIRRPTLIESQDEANIRRKAIKKLKKAPSTVVMSVARGKLTEGVELRVDGNTLIAAVIFVGLPYPKSDQITEYTQTYFKQKYGKQQAFFLTVTAPMMRAILQAGGRLIRDRNDRGIIALLDSRYKYCKNSFPKDWKHATPTTHIPEIRNEVTDFFRNS